MHRVRIIHETDFPKFSQLIKQTSIGYTNLPKDQEALKKLFDNALLTLQLKSRDPFYLFVLEKGPEIIGTAGIYAKRTHTEYFHLELLPLPPIFPQVPSYVSLIKRTHYDQEVSEIGGLFLSAKERQAGLGKLLSLSRFHFMASDLSRFAKNVYADMRGLITEEGVCPFWEAVGRHFFSVEYAELMKHQSEARALMPEHPIYLDLLAKEHHLGDTHPHTKPALEMLLKQGFKKTHDFDLYDGGPRVLAEVAKIKTVQESATFKIQSIESEVSTPITILSNEKLDFRACFGKVDPEKGSIDQESASLLEVDIGSYIRYSP